MRKGNQSGSTSVVIAVLSSILLVAVSGFAYWAFTGRQDYKNNVTPKINAAVATAIKSQSALDQQKFDAEAKDPNKVYQGSSTFGSVNFKYPKTWSAYVDETNPSEPINGYFHPDKVPGVQGGSAYALRTELVSTPYSQLLLQFSSKIQQGKVKATAYVPPRMVGKPNVQPGTRLDGIVAQSNNGTALQGSMVVIQVRDRTLEIYTEAPQFLPDFNNIVLSSLLFVP